MLLEGDRHGHHSVGILFFLHFKLLIGVVIVSGGQQRDSATHTVR